MAEEKMKRNNRRTAPIRLSGAMAKTTSGSISDLYSRTRTAAALTSCCKPFRSTARSSAAKSLMTIGPWYRSPRS